MNKRTMAAMVGGFWIVVAAVWLYEIGHPSRIATVLGFGGWATCAALWAYNAFSIARESK